MRNAFKGTREKIEKLSKYEMSVYEKLTAQKDFTSETWWTVAKIARVVEVRRTFALYHALKKLAAHGLLFRAELTGRNNRTTVVYAYNLPF